FQKQFTTEDTKETQTARNRLRSILIWWSIAGLLGGLAVLLRPDSGLFVAAIGVTLVLTTIWSAVAIPIYRKRHPFRAARKERQPETEPKRPRPRDLVGTLPAHSKKVFRSLAAGAAFSLAFILALAPWTIRNARVFHLFQPLAPAHGEMPGE